MKRRSFIQGLLVALGALAVPVTSVFRKKPIPIHTQRIAANPDRSWFWVENLGETDIWVRFGDTPGLVGFNIESNNSFSSNIDNVYTGDVVVSSVDKLNIRVTEA